jgi:D-alanyl-D-alanine carboxypeptidase
MTAPTGWDEVYKLYGDPHHFTKDDGTISPLWEARMSVAPFPGPLPLGWNKSKLAKGARVHTVILDEAIRVFDILGQEGLWSHLRTYDGGYTWRQQRSSTGILSLHAFGAALDFNAETNQQGTPGDMHPGIVQVFEACGWRWGGRFQGSRVDPMHFQFAKGV